MIRTSVVIAALLAAGSACSTASATFFSFASDTNASAFTFRGVRNPGSTSFQLLNDVVSNFALRVDDRNGPAPYIEIPVRFVSDLLATPATSAPLFMGSSVYRHVYTVSGSFQFVDPVTNELLLRVDIAPSAPSIMTVIGDVTSWGTAGGVIGADDFSDVRYTVTSAYISKIGGPASAAQYGISIPAGDTQVTSVGPDDFAFDLTVLNSGIIGNTVALDDSNSPLTGFFSEGSFSGSTIIPSPGAAALLGVGGLMAARRRRR